VFLQSCDARADKSDNSKVTSASPDWYDDPDRPGQKRYWDGSAWTEHRTEYAEAASRPAPEAPAWRPDERSFGLVVVSVLGGAAALIAIIVVVVLWVDSYNNGHARGADARDHGVSTSDAGSYCQRVATETESPGSADGYWDYPWIWGCKRALG